MQALFEPDEKTIKESNIYIYIQYINKRFEKQITDWEGVYAFSINESELFWLSLWEFLEIKGELGSSPITKNNTDMLNAEFYPEAKLNFAENLLESRKKTNDNICME